MAQLTTEEFHTLVAFLIDDHGLQRFRDKLVRLNALVTRRRAGSADRLSQQLYNLTGGLRREVPATYGIHSLWSEQLNQRLGEDGEKELESIAEKINDCLGDHDHVIEEKSTELDKRLAEYEKRLATSIGGPRARLDMILKAVPDVAERLRAAPVQESAPNDAE